jgi:hypothetical protein
MKKSGRVICLDAFPAIVAENLVEALHACHADCQLDVVFNHFITLGR